jgi:small subunit ribosomal protein S8e
LAIAQDKPKRKVTGGRYIRLEKKKVKYLGSLPTHTKLGAVKVQEARLMGGNTKSRLLSSDIVNVYDPKTKKYEKLKIETVKENPANSNFIRRNIMTKGAIVKTSKGNARITSRPGQEGSINAVLIGQ